MDIFTFTYQNLTSNKEMCSENKTKINLNETDHADMNWTHSE